MQQRIVTVEDLRDAWMDGWRAGRSARYARRLGIYEDQPKRDHDPAPPVSR